MELQISKAMFGSDMFGRLLYLSVSKNIDLDIVFSISVFARATMFCTFR